MRLPTLRRRAPRAVPSDGKAAAIEAAARSHAGSVRALNEDRLLALPGPGLWAIADGMGGHHAGDVAAQLVIDTIAAAAPGDADALQAAVDRAGQALTARAAAEGTGISGSTLVALLLDGAGYRCLWAGDSALWLIRDGRADKLTRDHSLVEALIEEGVISEAERRGHPQANVITRAIGSTDKVTLDRISGEARAGDMFLLCSDGLTDAIDPAQFGSLPREAPVESLADQLLARALANGASDNVSLILLRVSGG